MRLKYVTVLEVAWKWVLENLILGLARKKIILKFFRKIKTLNLVTVIKCSFRAKTAFEL